MTTQQGHKHALHQCIPGSLLSDTTNSVALNSYRIELPS